MDWAAKYLKFIVCYFYFLENNKKYTSDIESIFLLVDFIAHTLMIV